MPILPGFAYVWKVHKYLGHRYGQPCQVLICAKHRACLVEFQDGYKVRTLITHVRKIPPSPASGEGPCVSSRLCVSSRTG